MTVASWLGEIYQAGDEGLYVPGDSPDLADIEAALEEVAEPRRKRKFPRLNAAERRVIEEHAVEMTMEHFEMKLGYEVKDVGKKESYDVHATKADEVLKIEVKGTTSNGSEVILTRNEVDLHRKQHPANALVIVRNIKLQRSKGDQPPTASGGELIPMMPWAIEDDRLAPIAYRYTTGL